MEEDYWKLKLQINWLNHGDANTKFFQTSVLIRRRKNHIVSLFLDDNSEVHNQKGIIDHTKSYFQTLFTTSHHKSHVLSIPLSKTRLSDIDSEDLKRKPTDVEIRNVVFSFQPLKALGSDGLHPYFFQKYWDIVGPSIVDLYMKVFNTGSILEEINKTHVCLIPKCNNANSLKKFRPISLYNTSYKIITKIIARRMKSFNHKVIGPCQTSFLKNKQAADNAIIVQKIIRHFTKMKGKI